jgi:hypothetical protein
MAICLSNKLLRNAWKMSVESFTRLVPTYVPVIICWISMNQKSQLLVNLQMLLINDDYFSCWHFTILSATRILDQILLINFTIILRAAFFLQKFHVKLFCTYILGLCLLAQEYRRKVCSQNVGEIDTWSYYFMHYCRW